MPVFFDDGRKGLVLIAKDYADSYSLMHYRTPGSKNGVRLYQYKDGSLTPLGYIHYGIGQGRKSGQKYEKSDKVFVSGKVKYDKPLSGKIKREVKNIIKANSKILIGDAPGADTRVQEYLKKKNYQNVEVFTTDKEARNNVGGWKVNKIDASKYADEREARAQKDIAMTKSSNKGLAISSEDDRPDSATSKNVQRMVDQGSSMAIYDYKTKRFIDAPKSSSEKKVRGPSSEDSKHRMQGKWGDEGDPEYSRKILSKIDIPVESLSHIKKIGKNEDVAEIRKDINHRTEEGSELSNTGREFNCPNCACAFEMVERGYDVVARRAVDGSNVGDITKNFKGGELKQASYSDWEDNPLRLQAPKSKRERKKWDRWMNEWSNELRKARDESIGKLRDELETQGAGARGIIVVGWLPDYTTDATTSFHALNYKIESDGYLTLYDSQSYRKCNGVPDLGMLYGCDPRELHYMRTDNLELNDSITQMVYSRGRGDA